MKVRSTVKSSDIKDTPSGSIVYVKPTEVLNRRVRRYASGKTKKGDDLIEPGMMCNVSDRSLGNGNWKMTEAIEKSISESLGNIPTSEVYKDTKAGAILKKKGC